MEQLKQKILSEGVALGDDVLKVDAFLNHQLDPPFIMRLGEALARRFGDRPVEKVLTVEASGIAVALAAALQCNVPLVFARKKTSVLMQDECFRVPVFSYTKKETAFITVLKKFLVAGENILIIDDFLASGEAALGLASIAAQAGCPVVGIGIVIEKSFQPGAERLRQAGYRLESLVRIASLAEGKITFA